MNLGIPVASPPSGRASVAGSTISSNSIRQSASKMGTPIAPSRLRESNPTAIVETPASDNDGTARKRQRLSPVEDDEPDNDGGFLLDDDNDLQDIPEDEVAVEPTEGSISSLQESSLASSTGLTKKKRKKKSVLVKSKRRKMTSNSSVATNSVTEEEDNDEEQFSAPILSKVTRPALTESSNPRQPIQTIPITSSSGVVDKDDTVIGLDISQVENTKPATQAERSKVYNIFNPAQSNRSATIPAISRIQRDHGLANGENQQIQISSKPKVTASRRNKSSGNSKSSSSNNTKKKATSKKTQRAQDEKDQSSQVVVTVHRVAHISRLSFIDSEDDDELAANQTSTIRQKQSPNAIDVLAQICQEIISKHLKALSTQSQSKTNTKTNTNLNHQRASTRQFGEELDDRLLMMTTALDHNISLTRNLKSAIRHKTTHRTTLLHLRQQRENIMLQQDAIRAANEAAAKHANERFELNTLLGDIELAVQRGQEGDGGNDDDAEEDEEEEEGQDRKGDLASRLQRIGEVVSSARGRVGLLQRVRGLNDLLEGVVRRGGL